MKRALLLLLLLLTAACGPDVRTGVILSLRGDPAGGEQLWGAQCASCHGEDAEGTDLGPALGAKSDDALVEQILGGSLLMPAFGDTLGNQDIADIVSWTREGLAIAAE